jgi:hypothetical protein
MLFNDSTKGGKPIEGPIDATGRPQILFFGPYVHLPSGVWRARTVVAFSEQLVGQSFRIEIVSGREASTIADRSFPIDAPGRHDLIVDFENDDYSTPLEVRLSSERGVFDGSLSLGYVEFSTPAESSN